MANSYLPQHECAVFFRLSTWKTGLKGWEIDGGDKQWLDGLVLHTATEIALKEEIKSIQRARKQGLAFRNLLVLGPSGNGKSKLVRLLADESGLDCAIVNASNFGPWGGSAAAELHTLFAWARHSSKGKGVLSFGGCSVLHSPARLLYIYTRIDGGH